MFVKRKVTRGENVADGAVLRFRRSAGGDHRLDRRENPLRERIVSKFS